MASWVAKLQSMYLAVGLLLALVHLHSTWLEGEVDDTHVQSFVPGGVAGFQPPRRSLLAKTSLKIRAVNLGGWLVLEGWIKPELFDNLDTTDNDLLDGTGITLQSTSTGKYVVAENGGGSTMKADRDTSSSWETFKIWRVSPGVYQLRVENKQFVGAINNGGGNVQATATTPLEWETFKFTRNGGSVHIQAGNGMYFQAKNSNQLTADFNGTPKWGKNDHTFTLKVLYKMAGEFQLANAWGPGAAKAKTVFKNHRDTFIQEKDFVWLKDHGINAVRIPVGYWIAYGDNPPAPYVSGSLQALDNAFSWGIKNGIQVIIDLHAAPGGQNFDEHSSTRDGVALWGQKSNFRTQSIAAIDFLAKRYKDNKALLGIELLNEPRDEALPDLDILTDYYKEGYNTVRKYSSTAYVIMSQIIGDGNGRYKPSQLVSILPDDNVVLDIHPYLLFNDALYEGKSVQWNIDYTNINRSASITSLSKGNALLLVGEWTNEFKVPDATQSDYMKLAKAQETVFGRATFGWAHWTFRNALDHWSYETSVNKGYMPSFPVS